MVHLIYIPSEKYHLEEWDNIYFPSREKEVQLNGWLFNYFENRPIVIVVHGIFPNGKCKPESNLIASLLIKNNINVLTIDLRNYGDSSSVSKYENLGLSEYKDVLGAFDFLQQNGFPKYQIGLHGISLGGTSVIFAAEKEPSIRAIWLDSSLAEFKLILKDELARYGFPHDFGPAVSLAGKILTGIDPTKLSPAFSLKKNQHYFFTHGDKDLRVLPHHFYFFQKYAKVSGGHQDNVVIEAKHFLSDADTYSMLHKNQNYFVAQLDGHFIESHLRELNSHIQSPANIFAGNTEEIIRWIDEL